MFELHGKVALVTGAAKRVGRAVALGLAGQGMNIIIHYRRSEKEAIELKGQIRKLNVNSWIVQEDLINSEACKNLVEEALKVSGRLDVLVNNASIFAESSLDTSEIEDFQSSMLVNAWVPFILCRKFSKVAKQGKIVNILDTRIQGYDFKHFSYYLSKKTLSTLTESLALKLAPNITVNAIAPGLILPPEGKNEDYLEQKKQFVPLKRHGSPEDVAEAVIFFLKNDFITGQTIYVDGGKHLTPEIEDA